MKAVLASVVLIAVNTFSISNTQAATGFNAEQLCKAGLALAVDKQPRGTKATSGKSNHEKTQRLWREERNLYISPIEIIAFVGEGNLKSKMIKPQ